MQMFSIVSNHFTTFTCQAIVIHAWQWKILRQRKWALTLLGSGSEWPKDEALLLIMLSYLKKLKFKYKRENKILWAVLEGCTNRAWAILPILPILPISRFLKNCQNGTFWPMYEIWFFLSQMTSFEVLKNSP